MIGPPATSARFRAWLAGGAKLALGAGLLVFVLRSLPWQDEVSVADRDGTRSYAGEILGDWRPERVRFRVDPRSDPASLPADWRARMDRTGAVELARGPALTWTPGVPRVFASVDAAGLAIAMALLFLAVLLQTTRWWRLLAAVQCPMRWASALRLTLYGLFASLLVPGHTGGDVLRAVLAARAHPGRGASASSSVLIDRVLSLLVLAAMGAFAVIAEDERLRALRNLAFVAIAAGLVFAILYGNRRLRAALAPLPWLARAKEVAAIRQIDEAILVYCRRPVELALAAAISLGNHLCVAVAILVVGRAFGDAALSLVQYVAVSAIGNIASALPISPGGWGIGEAVYQYLFEVLGGDGTIGVAVSITFKLMLGAIGLCGGVALVLPGGARLADVRQARVGS